LFTPLGRSSLAVPAVLAAGMAAGACWSLFPAVLRACLSVTESISTLLLNYIALLFVDYLIYWPWTDPGSRAFPLSASCPPAARPFSRVRIHRHPRGLAGQTQSAGHGTGGVLAWRIVPRRRRAADLPWSPHLRDEHAAGAHFLLRAGWRSLERLPVGLHQEAGHTIAGGP